MDAALAARALAHENRDTEHDWVFRVMLQDFAFGHELGLSVKRGRSGHIGGAVGSFSVSVENHIGRDVD